MQGRNLLTGCGILKKEINYLIEKNSWNIDTSYFDSSLHVDFEKLIMTLKSSLEKNRDRKQVVFYGTCHPVIDIVVDGKNSVRTAGQNCVEILLGKEHFTRELEKGAFFLMEDWALRWKYITFRAFGDNMEIIKMIFQSEHKYFNCIRTVCSGDFSIQAEDISRETGLGLVWTDAGLENLEIVLLNAMRELNG